MQWNTLILREFNFKLISDSLILRTIPDGIEYLLGSIKLGSGSYKLRIYYKHENIEYEDDWDGNLTSQTPEDTYKIQAWLGDLIPTTVLFLKNPSGQW